MIRIVVSGAAGRMGKRIIELARRDPDFEVVAGIDLKTDPASKIVRNLGEINDNYDCIVEFTLPEATVEHVRAAAKLKKPMVIGTTGLSDAQFAAVKKASGVIPIVFSPNMSQGVNIFFDLIGRSAAILGRDYKVRIKETHHMHKKDKPSGTAKLMAGIVKEKLGADAPVEAVREGEVVGDHDIVFESETDILKISHSAKTRDIFALGALKAAKFVVKKNNGLFSMPDVLGLGK